MLDEFNVTADTNEEETHGVGTDVLEQLEELDSVTKSLVAKTREKLMKKAMNHVRKASYDQIFNLKIMDGIPDDYKIKLFEEYLAEWDLQHSNLQNLEEIKKAAKKESTTDKLKRFVIEHMDDPIMNFIQFAKVIKSWNLGKKSRKEWYDEYKKLYFNQPGKTIEIKEEVRDFGNGFKRKKGMDDIKNSCVTNHFNLKDNKKYYTYI